MKATIAFHRVEKLIYKTVHAFRRRFGGDWDDLLSEAHERFMDALTTHNPHKGTLAKRVAYTVWYGLLDSFRSSLNRAKRMTYLNEEQWRQLEAETHFNPEEFIANLSRDAAKTAKLIMTPPADLGLDVRTRDRLQRIPSRRGAIIEFLRDLGWSFARIAEVFSEIHESFSGE